MNPLGNKTLIKYILLQIPDLALLIIALVVAAKFIIIPVWLLAAIIAVWIAKDIALYPKLRKAYEVNTPTQAGQLIGMKGTIMDKLDPEGYIKVKGELWKAEMKDPGVCVQKGAEVKVVDARGMNLVVEIIKDN